jgi:DNA polymerase III alpha subunit
MEKREGFLKNECRPYSPNGDPQLGLNQFVVELAEKYGDKILISDDSHFAYENEKIIQDIRLNQRETEKGMSASWIFSNSHHRRSTADAKAYFDANMPVSDSKLQEWVENTHQWADKFKDFKFKTTKSLPTSFYPKDTLAHTMSLIETNGRMNWKDKGKVTRLQNEIQLLHKNGHIDLLPYFFIDNEVCAHYLKNGKLTGPGRGSAAGLLLSYLLGITHIDPIKYQLSVDRFITLDRIKSGKLPDIDQDLGSRDLLIDIKEEDGFSVELEDGSFVIIPKTQKINTSNGLKTIEEAFENGFDVDL